MMGVKIPLRLKVHNRNNSSRLTIFTIIILAFVGIIHLVIVSKFTRALNVEPFVIATSEGTSDRLLKSGQSEVLCICHSQWTGIKMATYAQGFKVVEINEYRALSDSKILSKIIEELKVKHVVVNGIPPGTLNIPASLKRTHPNVLVSFIYHGTPASHPSYMLEGLWLSTLIDMACNNEIFRLGFVRRNLAETFASMGVPRVHGIDNNMLKRPVPATLAERQNGVVKIGGLFWFNTMKNPMTQLLAACSIPNAEVHVLELPDPLYLKHCAGRLVVHGILPRNQVLRLIQQMDVILYASLSESSGLMALDALSMGVPCIVSHTGGYLRESDPLFEHLVVLELNSPKAIEKKIREVVVNRDVITPMMQNFVEQYRKEAQVSIRNFFDISGARQEMTAAQTMNSSEILL